MRNNPKTAEEMYSETRSSCMSYSDFLFKQNEDLRKQVERLQEQLHEANNIIVKADWDCDYALQSKCGFSDYLKKYDVRGVK